MIDAYRRRAWAEALDEIAGCRELDRFDLQDFYDLYERRIADFRETPPDADWEGVFVATEK
jgi:adenylate cyclase